MISWAVIIYGAALSAVVAGALVAVAARGYRLQAGAGAATAAIVGPLAWNAILHATHADSFFTDAPLAVLPASWQDAGSGVFTMAVASLLYGIGPSRSQPSGRTAAWGLLAGLAAFAVDVYLY